MRFIWGGLWFAFVGLGVGASVHADILVDSAAFDKAYIPVLYYTNTDKADQARAAMPRLERAWDVFARQHRRDYASDTKWTDGFSKIDHQIAEAANHLKRADPLSQAHDALEPVRVVLMNLRRDHGWAYYVDALTAFHEPMEKVVLAAKGKTPQTFTENDRARIQNEFAALEAKWEDVKRARIDPNIYKFDGVRVAEVRTLVATETNRIQQLKKALKDPDVMSLIKSATAIKPAFADLVKQFGDFSAS